MEQEEEGERERVVRVASLQGKNVSSCFHSKEEECNWLGWKCVVEFVAYLLTITACVQQLVHFNEAIGSVPAFWAQYLGLY